MDIFLRSISGILVILGMILVGFVIGEKVGLMTSHVAYSLNWSLKLLFPAICSTPSRSASQQQIYLKCCQPCGFLPCLWLFYLASRQE